MSASTLTISEEYAAPYEVVVAHEPLPDGAVLLRASFDDGAILLTFSPEERRSWPLLAARVGEAVDAWYVENGGFPYVFTQLGLRYQLQTAAQQLVWAPPPQQVSTEWP